MKRLSSSQWDRVEYNPLNHYVKIGYYDINHNSFVEVARFRNAYTHNGSNYGLLQIWDEIHPTYAFFNAQGSNNTCGGYNKPIANLEGCLYQFKEEIKKSFNEDFTFSDCGSIDSLTTGLMNYLQSQYRIKLFKICC